MNEETICCECGSPLPHNSPQQLCPKCLLQRGLEADTLDTATGRPAEHATQWSPPAAEKLAADFPEFEIVELIGRGGMGAVYKARQKNLQRWVALKILPPEIGQDAAFAERFAREARAMARLSHPHIVPIYDFGQRRGLYFFLMEYIDGLSLRQLMDSGNVSPLEALAIVPQICEALQFAHDQGIVHRDIKPENILLDKRGQVKIADFGLARLMGLPGGAAGGGTAGNTQIAEAAAGVTQAGDRVMGTPQYMAPEQRERPHEVDHRADIYSLGVVFYQMLTGELPRGRFEPPSRKVQIDVRLDEVVLRALEKEPDRRYQQASQVRTEVETIAATTRPPKKSWKRRLRNVAISLVAALALAFLLKTFVLEVYYITSDAVAPQVAEGSRVLVFKLMRSFDRGQIVVYHRDGRNMLGRVAEAGPHDGLLMVERRSQPPQAVPIADVAGLVILNWQGLPTAEQDEQSRQAPEWTAEMPEGVVVELVGVSDQPWKAPWWRPDGRPAQLKPFETAGFYFKADSKSTLRFLALRLRNIPPDLTVLKIRGETDAGKINNWTDTDGVGGWLQGKTGQDYVHDPHRLCVMVPISAQQAFIEVGLAYGPWQPAVRCTGKGEVAETLLPELLPKEVKLESKGDHLSVAATYSSRVDLAYATRVVAKTATGSKHSVRPPMAMHMTFNSQTENILYYQLNNVNDSDIIQLTIEARPYHWAVFNGIQLQPPSGARAVPAAPAASSQPKAEVSVPPPEPPADVIGRWKVVEGEGQGGLIDFFADGKAVYLQPDHKPASASYAIEDRRLTLLNPDNRVAPRKVLQISEYAQERMVLIDELEGKKAVLQRVP